MTPAQCRASRAWLQISQDDLAKAANVGVSTVRDFELGKRIPIAATLAAMRSYLEARGIGFVFADDGEQTKACGITYSEPKKGMAH